MCVLHDPPAPSQELSSFSQWRKSLAKNPDPRQITWLCGDEGVLIEDVVAYVKGRLQPAPWNYVPLVAGQDSERTIWAEVDQLPLGAGNRVIIIRSAEKLKEWDRFEDWIKNRSRNPRTFLILVSNEERIPRTELTREQKRKGETATVLPHVAAIGTKGHVIECRPYTNATAKYAVEWVKSKIKKPMRDGIAAHLLNRADGDLRLVRDVCFKLALFPGEITISTVNGMFIERPRDSFADALLALDKKTALLALRDLPVADYSRTLGFLDSRLDLAGMVHDMLIDHKPQTEIARAAGAQSFLVKDIIPVSKHYDTKRRLAIRKILAITDEAIQSGNSVGIMEALVLLW